MSHGRRLGPTDLAGRTARVWLIPSAVEGLDVTAAPFAGLPRIVEAGGLQQIHVIADLAIV
jgi:hypothetical protein